jgi:hypothetical protein
MLVSFYGEGFYRVFTRPARRPPPTPGKVDQRALMDIKSPPATPARQ